MEKIKLPVDPYLTKISESFVKTENMILTSPPGSGKTTRVPPALMNQFKNIIVLVPRRIAAVSSAARICDENGYNLGEEVGYQVRFENKTNENTRLIFMTVGLFIKKINDKNFYSKLELVIFDEFHERSADSDLALGICYERQILGEKLKLLIMSATLNVSELQSYLSNSVHIDIENPTFPVEIIKSKKSQKLACDQQFLDNLVEVMKIAVNKSQRDILIFLPGLYEIKAAERALSSKFGTFEINLLHGSIKLEEQKKILLPSNKRRIILSTNVAESSITIPSVDCVVDSGLEKKARSESKIGFSRLEISRISLFSARQRAGRAGRTSPGLCYQLWHDLDERSMSEQIQPEILNSDLLEETLILSALDIKNPDDFSWLTKPKRKFSDALEKLSNWGLINTDKGRLVQSCPLGVELSLLFVELSLLGHQEKAATLMAFLETQNMEKLTEMPELDNLPLSEFGNRIKKQLMKIQFKTSDAPKELSFRSALFEIFFRNFPNKIAKHKDKNFAVSSLGRGVELSPQLCKQTSAYYILLSGRELNSAVTKCDFYIGFSDVEFLKFSQQHVKLITEIHYDKEKQKLFKIDKKIAGNFILSESARTYLNGEEAKDTFIDYFKKNNRLFLHEHPHYEKFEIKLNFLKKCVGIETDLLENFNLDNYADYFTNAEEFFSFNLYEALLQAATDEIRNFLKQMPTTFKFPSGREVSIDYAGEQAPKISARLQDYFGLAANPTILGGKIRLTLEMLAPNNRPTQVTNQLENFWKASYHEIKKELKSRYPKHAWPDDPINYKREKG